METFLGITPIQAENIVRLLNELLANYHVHYQKMRNFHWNVYGQQFFELHDQFEQLYTQAHSQIDEIAERVLTLGAKPVSNFSDYLYISNVKEPEGHLKPSQMVAETLKDLETLIVHMNEVVSVASEAGDDGTADLITGFSKFLEKKHWMFRAFLEKTILV